MAARRPPRRAAFRSRRRGLELLSCDRGR